LTPKISIIIPCYNIETHLSKCVSSVINQTFSDFELLLLNDGSTDTTLQVCDKLKNIDSRIKVFTHPNKGVSYTRNRGIELAVGECIMFIDGDDYVKEDYLEYFIKAYKSSSWTLCGFINVKQNQLTENKYYSNLLELFPQRKIEKIDFLKVLAYYSLSSPCAKIYDRKIIMDRHILFDKNITYQEDLVFNLEYVKYINEIRILDYFGYFYIEHTNSSTSRFHKNFDHIELLYNSLHSMVVSSQDKLIVREFIFQTILRKISNIFHTNSKNSKIQKLNELKEIFNSESFRYVEKFIFQSKINVGLKSLLKLKNSFLIYNYYKLFH